jgi:hypothetical protein
MALTTYLLSFSQTIMSFCDMIVRGLLYFLLFKSIGAYSILTWWWANTVLQPITATILTFLLIGRGVYPNCNHTTTNRPDYRSKKGAVQSSFFSIWAAPLGCAFGLHT